MVRSMNQPVQYIYPMHHSKAKLEPELSRIFQPLLANLVHGFFHPFHRDNFHARNFLPGLVRLGLYDTWGGSRAISNYHIAGLTAYTTAQSQHNNQQGCYESPEGDIDTLLC